MMNLSEALQTLGLAEISQMDENQLQKITKEAVKSRCLDDTTSMEPHQNVLQVFKDDFFKIRQAAAVVRMHISKAEEQPTLENTLKLRSELKSHWEHIQQNRTKKITESVIVSPGRTVDELLDLDFSDKIPEYAIRSFAATTLWLVPFLVLISGVIFALAHLTKLFYLILLSWPIALLSSILMTIPLSRFWLPKPVVNCAIAILSRGVAAQKVMTEGDGWITLIIKIYFLFVRIIELTFKYALLVPTHHIIRHFFGDRVLGRLTRRTVSFAGVNEDRIKGLLKHKSRKLTEEDQRLIRHLHKELVVG